MPLTPHGFRDASTDAATIEALWCENPGALISVAIAEDPVRPSASEQGGFIRLD
ncbi:MAG: hypothetical protein WAV18_06110 [Roseiarcus sp.]